MFPIEIQVNIGTDENTKTYPSATVQIESNWADWDSNLDHPSR